MDFDTIPFLADVLRACYDGYLPASLPLWGLRGVSRGSGRPTNRRGVRVEFAAPQEHRTRRWGVGLMLIDGILAGYGVRVKETRVRVALLMSRCTRLVMYYQYLEMSKSVINQFVFEMLYLLNRNPFRVGQFLICRFFCWISETTFLSMLCIVHLHLIGWYLVFLMVIILEFYNFIVVYSYYMDLMEEYQEREIEERAKEKAKFIAAATAGCDIVVPKQRSNWNILYYFIGSRDNEKESLLNFKLHLNIALSLSYYKELIGTELVLGAT
ncbi:hypothetical protein SFRURICE_006593 [Spodoptera frugiperda]|nr:hypothetical protein SFRURICE_006593 [Spodoptera frugiperda]